MTSKIAILAGDGIGPEIMDATLAVGERELPLADAVDELDDGTLSHLGIESDLLFS